LKKIHGKIFKKGDKHFLQKKGLLMLPKLLIIFPAKRREAKLRAKF
jgi:hypothetical protein